jgi:hypothetical protein
VSLGEYRAWRRYASLSEATKYRAMRFALREIARKGCERLVDPSTCRKPNGYPREEWCDRCIAAEGLGLPRDWFVMKP